MNKTFLFPLIVLSLVLFSGCATTVSNVNFDAVPKPGESTCVIYGVLLNSDKDPISESIFLSRNITYDNPDLPATVSFSYQTDPKGELNPENGVFYFDDVEPGENYVISVFTGSGAPLVVKGKNSDQPLIISVAAGEAVNLGELIIDIQ